MALRKVRIYDTDRLSGERILFGEGFFHRFGSDFEEFESGPGNYPIAIVELYDGEVKSVPIESIEFIEPLKQEKPRPRTKDIADFFGNNTP